jgi:hypothetical protein
VTIDIDTLIAELKDRAPVGVELPRNISTNAVNETTLARWAADAAGEINLRMKRTTIKETTITTTVDTQDYDLPANCREVVEIIRSHVSDVYETLGIPNTPNTLAIANFGTLPSGQEVDASIDLINRGRLQRMRREDDFEQFGTQIRFLFPVDADEKIRVRYRAIDRSLATVPDDRFELVMTYMLWKTLDRHIVKHGANIAVDGDGFANQGMAAFTRLKLDKEQEWISGLNSIGPEVT